MNDSVLPKSLREGSPEPPIKTNSKIDKGGILEIKFKNFKMEWTLEHH